MVVLDVVVQKVEDGGCFEVLYWLAVVRKFTADKGGGFHGDGRR